MLERNHNIDSLAYFLRSLGQQAASLPPVWDGAKISQPVCGPQGEYIGLMLPGKGLLLADDLKNYGISRPLPYVFERSAAFRLRDMLKSERGAITTLAGLLTARAANKHGFNGWFSKISIGSNGGWGHSFLRTTNQPGAGSYTAIPGGSAKDQTSTGALNFGWSQPTAPDKAFILSVGMSSLAAGFNIAVLIDLLVGAGTIDPNVNTAQTINTTTLTRNTGAAGVMAFMEVTTALGATPTTVTINKYTNQAGTTAHTTHANTIVASAIAGRVPFTTCAPFFGLQAGDFGVKSIEEITFAAAMGSGAMAVVLCMPLVWIPTLPPAAYAKRDDMSNINGATELALTSGGLIGCLSLLANAAASNSQTYIGEVEIAIG